LDRIWAFKKLVVVFVGLFLDETFVPLLQAFAEDA